MSTECTPTPTRDRLVGAMLDGLRRKGLHGIGLTELLTMAQAPKGVLYHHFPGGKAELAVVTIETVVVQIVDALDKLFRRNADPVEALAAWMASAQKSLAGSGFENGCPLAAVALESTPDDVLIRSALAHGFAEIRERISLGLQAAGIAERQAGNLAALLVSAYEGALVQARVAGSVDAMQNTTDALLAIVRSSLPNQQEES